MSTRTREASSFRRVSFWTRVSQAGRRLVLGREARKQAVIRLLDEVKRRAQTPPVRTGV